MARPRSGEPETLTPLEHEIMNVLWSRGASSVADVQGELGAERAYTTVQTMLNILLKKGKVRREAVGRAFVYAPLVTRQSAARAALGELLTRAFNGSGEALLMALVDERHVRAADIEKARALLGPDAPEGGSDEARSSPNKLVDGRGKIRKL